MDTIARDANAASFELAPTNFRRISLSLVQPIASARSTVMALAVGVIGWELAARLWNISFLPPFTNALSAAIQMIASGQILGSLAASLVALLTGYGLAVVLGVILGLLMGRHRKIEYLLDLYVNALLATPNIALVPLLYAVFGLSRTIEAAVVFLSAFPVVVINTKSAIGTVDTIYIEMARSFGAKERQLFWKILLPGAMPLMMAGLRLGMGRAVRGMINGEMFIALFGLGALLRLYGNRFDAEKVFAILLVVMTVALVFSSAVQALERHVTRWTETRL